MFLYISGTFASKTSCLGMKKRKHTTLISLTLVSAIAISSTNAFAQSSDVDPVESDSIIKTIKIDPIPKDALLYEDINGSDTQILDLNLISGDQFRHEIAPSYQFSDSGKDLTANYELDENSEIFVGLPTRRKTNRLRYGQKLFKSQLRNRKSMRASAAVGLKRTF